MLSVLSKLIAVLELHRCEVCSILSFPGAEETKVCFVRVKVHYPYVLFQCTETSLSLGCDITLACMYVPCRPCVIFIDGILHARSSKK